MPTVQILGALVVVLLALIFLELRKIGNALGNLEWLNRLDNLAGIMGSIQRVSDQLSELTDVMERQFRK